MMEWSSTSLSLPWSGMPRMIASPCLAERSTKSVATCSMVRRLADGVTDALLFGWPTVCSCWWLLSGKCLPEWFEDGEGDMAVNFIGGGLMLSMCCSLFWFYGVWFVVYVQLLFVLHCVWCLLLSYIAHIASNSCGFRCELGPFMSWSTYNTHNPDLLEWSVVQCAGLHNYEKTASIGTFVYYLFGV